MKVCFYVITNSMYSYQKLTRHRLCQFVQYESITIFLREMKYFFSLCIYQGKNTFLYFFYLYCTFLKTENCFNSLKSNFGNFNIFISFCLKKKIYIL